MTDMALARGTNMDAQDRQDWAQIPFGLMIVGDYCATLLVKERSFRRTK
jgi:hypothetical protein